MRPISLNTLPQEFKIPQALPAPPKADVNGATFADTLKQFVSSVSDLQSQAAGAEQAFMRGEISDVHQVMIAVEEASVAFDLLMEIRNKLLEAYQTIQRMPI